uniref:Uncharacterized protein n=1 Tax=Anguilla anguilla TaxID=7936 RepID=A0A0E9XZD2_ANGAN
MLSRVYKKNLLKFCLSSFCKLIYDFIFFLAHQIDTQCIK